MLAYGVPTDATNEYVKIGESTVIESLKKFCRTVMEIFSQQYLRRPNSTDIARLLHIGEERGFFWNVGQFGLYALEVENLSNIMGWTVCRP